MSSTTPDTSSAGLTPSECVRLVRENRRRWLAPTLVCAVLAGGYAMVMSRYWEASQALVVRKQATVSSTNSPGKFADLYEMRTFQETILELAKSRRNAWRCTCSNATGTVAISYPRYWKRPWSGSAAAGFAET